MLLTKDEAEIYDRQIRLWGVNAQSRLRQSKVLMLGFNGVASEVAKILTLAGIDTLTIVDDHPLQKSDLTSNLFCRAAGSSDDTDHEKQFRTHQVKDKLRTLNPLVKVNIDNTPILSKKSDDFRGYDLVTLHSFMLIDEINSINKMCRENNVKFYLVLDYGFFGFIFNDLGPEFKFTYEEFDKVTENKQQISQIPVPKQSGEKKDPINFDDDEEEEETVASSDDDDGHDKRPKKRRRHHSPVRQDANHAKDKNEKKHKVDILSYVTFGEMISFKNTSFDKKSSPILFISIAMLKFFSKHKHLPNVHCSDNGGDKLMEQDLSSLNEIISSLKDSLNLHESIFKKLDPEWSSNISGSLSPVCAIVGGVAGQDMIRSLSNKDIPICNTFSFDGIDMSGVVERLGLKNEKNATNAPVIRDYLEID